LSQDLKLLLPTAVETLYLTTAYNAHNIRQRTQIYNKTTVKNNNTHHWIICSPPPGEWLYVSSSKDPSLALAARPWLWASGCMHRRSHAHYTARRATATVVNLEFVPGSSIHHTVQWRSQRGVVGFKPPLKKCQKIPEEKFLENTQSWSLHVLNVIKRYH